MFAVLVIGMAVGVVASLLVRSGPALARAGAVLAMLAVLVAAVVPPRAERVTLPARIGVASTSASEDQGVRVRLEQAAAAAEPRATVAFARGGATLADTVARAALLAGPRTEEVLLVWNGPLPAPATQATPAAPSAGAAYTTAAPLPFEPEDLALHAVTPPRSDRPLRLEASIAGATAAVPARVDLGDGVERAVAVPAHGSAAIDLAPRASGASEVKVTVDLPGHRIERSGSLVVEPAPRLLVIEQSGVLAAALRAQGVDVQSTSELPADLPAGSSLLLGAPLPLADQERLLRAVDDGLGLFAVGAGLQGEGEPLRALLPVRPRPQVAAPGPGAGEGDEPTEQPPPAQPPPTQPPPPPPSGTSGADAVLDPAGPVEVDKHAIAMVFVIDRSGSMGDYVTPGHIKMSYAKTSAVRTAAALGEGDEVGIVTFGNEGQGRVVMPLTPATDRQGVLRGIEGLAHANEATWLLAGLEVARDMLLASKTAVRHVVVITDGEVRDPELTLTSIAREMRRQRMTLSIVSIVGSSRMLGYTELAQRVAQVGGGAFLPVADATMVPQLVSAEVVRALDRVGRKPKAAGAPGNDANQVARPDPPAPQPPQPEPPQPEPPQPEPAQPEPSDGMLAVRAVAASPLLLPATQQWPGLRAVVPSTATLDAHVLLVAGDAGHPVLAFANRGLGRVGAFAADLAGDAAAEFRRDAAFPARLAQWLAAVSPSLPSPPIDLLTQTAVEPPAPTPRECVVLAAFAGGPPQSLDALRLPPPRSEVRHESQVPDAALAAVALLLLLAALEWWCSHRRA